MSIRPTAAAVALCALLLAACSASSDTTAPAAPAAAASAQAKAAADAKAGKDLALYEQMRSNQNWDLAASLGTELIGKYPDSAAAVQVKQSLAEVQAKSHEQAETKRLARLWAYSVSAEPGGTQYAASIESKQPISQGLGAKDTKRAHLILRQHPQWGQNVYIYLDNERFDCRSGCPSLPVSFDGEAARLMKATIPPTGEPSLFIDDDKTVIVRILKSRSVAIDVVLKSAGKKTLVFETGGLDMTHLPGATKATAHAKKKN